MASEQVGEAHVDIHVNASPAEAELDAFMAKSDRDFAEFGRKKAEATLGLKAADFDKQIDEAKGKLDYFKSRRATATLDLAKKHFDEEVAAAKAQLAALNKKKATITVDTRQIKAAHKEMSLLGKEQELSEKRALGQAKAERKLSQERSKATTDAFKQRAELARLSDEYERLKGKQEKLEKSSRGVFSSHSVARAEKERRAIARVGDELEYAKHKIESLGGSVDGLDGNVSKNSSLLDKWASRLGDTSVRIGPLTTSIKGLVAGVGLLGPLLFDLAGGAIDVIGFLGAGIAGAASVGAAGLAGFATSALGVGLVIKPMVKEFGEAKKASEALAKAELKYGKGSTQAKTAQEQFNHVMKGVSPIAKEAFQSYGKLGGEWRKLTSAARPAVFEAFGQGLKTVQALLPQFASESVKTTQVAAKAWGGWMKALRSSGAKQALGEIMSNFRASIPGIASGLESIGATLGHISAAASHFLPGLSHGFADWAANLEKSVGSGKGLQHSIGGLVGDMRDFGHLAQTSGSFLVHFLGDAAESGDELNNSLTGVIKSWDKGIQTPKGKESLTNYFHESAEATKDFFSIVGGASKLLFEFSQATAPVANGLLHIVTFLGDFVSAADEIVGVKTVFQALGGVLAGLWVVGKVQGYIGAIAGVLTKLGLLSGVAAADAAAMDANTAAVAANTVALEANAVAAGEAAGARGLGALETGAADAAAALGGAEASAAGFSALLAPEVLVPVAAVGALVYFSTQIANNKSKFEEAAEAYQESGQKLRHTTQEIAKSSNTYNDGLVKQTGLNAQAKEAQEKLIKVQEKHGVSSKQFAQAERELAAIEQQQISAARTSGIQRTKSLHQAEQAVTVAKEHIKAAREERRAANDKEQGSAGNPTEIYADPDRTKHLAEAAKQEAQALREVATAAREVNIAQIPLERQKAHLHALDTETITGLRQLQPLIGKAATTKIGNFVDPNAVSQITKLSNKLKSVGQGPAVKKIDVKSQGADQTLSKLQRLNKQTGKVTTARVKIEGNDTNANNSLKRVSQMAQRLAGSKPVLRILGDSSNAQDAINKLSHLARGVIQKEYKAEIKAADKTGPGFNTAKHHLRDVANTKAEAKISALDKTKAAIGTAKGGLKGVANGKYEAKVTAVNQTAAGISEAESALNAIAAHTVEIPIYGVYRGTKGSPPSSGGAAGGAFAIGGTPDHSLVQRAAERAERQAVKSSTFGAKIQKPTFLTGEEGSTHPEFVIATNPAYRRSNEDYLEAAAASFGKTVIPAYARGHGGGNSDSKKGTNAAPIKDRAENSTQLKDPGPPPSIKKWEKHHRTPTSVNHGPGIKLFNEKERDISDLEGQYQAELTKEEREIAIYKNSKGARGRSAWDFPLFKGLRNKLVADEKTIVNKAIPLEIKNVTSVQKHAEGTWASAHGKKENAEEHLKTANAILQKEEHLYKTVKQGKHENSSQYSAKKIKYKTEIEKQKVLAEKWEDRIKLFKEKMDAAEGTEKEAKEEIESLKQEAGPTAVNALKEQENSSSELQAIESGELEAPYAEPPAESEEKLTPFEAAELKIEQDELASGPNSEKWTAQQKEQIINDRNAAVGAAEAEMAAAPPGTQKYAQAFADYKTAKEALVGEGAEGGNAEHATLGEQTATVNEARQQLYEQFASNITNAPPSPLPNSMFTRGGGGPSYAGATTALGSLAPVAAGSTSAAPSGTVNNVTNNFAAPPPDPHTFTKNLEFELNA